MEIKQVKVEHVQLITSLRLEEVFNVIAEDLARIGVTKLLRAGVLLCGGCSRTANIVNLAEKVFQMNVCIGHANAVSGLASTLDEPEFATAIGLVKYGTLQRRKPVARLSWWARLKELIKKLIAMVR